MNNATSLIMSAAGRVSAPPTRQQSPRSDSNSDFLQTVKKATVSESQKKDAAVPADRNQASQDEEKKTDQSHDLSEDTPKAETELNGKDNPASQEAAAAETAGLLSNQIQAQTQSQVENQVISVPSTAAAAATKVSASQPAQANQTLIQAQTLAQMQEFSDTKLAANLQKGKGLESNSNEASPNRQGISLNMETKAMADSPAEKTLAGGKAPIFGQAAAGETAEPSTGLAAEVLETGKAASQSEEGKNPVQPGIGLRKTEKASADKIGENRGDISLQSSGVPQEEAKASDLVKIKVGEGPLNPQSNQFPQDVAKTVLRYSQDGKSEFDIQLTPKELGTIHIQLVFDKGTASVLMNCADPKTQNLLSLNTEQIRSIVQGETGLHTTVQVKEDPSSQNGRQDFDGRGENPQRDAQRQEQQRRNQLDQELFSQQFRMEFQRTGTDGAAF